LFPFGAAARRAVEAGWQVSVYRQFAENFTRYIDSNTLNLYIIDVIKIGRLTNGKAAKQRGL
jgi:hypothetical protein